VPRERKKTAETPEIERSLKVLDCCKKKVFLDRFEIRELFKIQDFSKHKEINRRFIEVLKEFKNEKRVHDDINV